MCPSDLRAPASDMPDAMRQMTGDDVSLEDHVSGDELSELLRDQGA